MSLSRSLIKDEGIVLHKRRLLNEHMAVTVLGRDSGKISLIAKGLRSFTSRRSAHIQTGNIIAFGYSKITSKGNYLSHATLISHFLDIKRRPEQLRLFYLVLFMFNALLPNEVPDMHMYQFCKKCIVKINSLQKITSADTFIFMNDILEMHGYPANQTLEGCRSALEEIIGKKIPKGVL